MAGSAATSELHRTLIFQHPPLWFWDTGMTQVGSWVWGQELGTELPRDQRAPLTTATAVPARDQPGCTGTSPLGRQHCGPESREVAWSVHWRTGRNPTERQAALRKAGGVCTSDAAGRGRPQTRAPGLGPNSRRPFLFYPITGVAHTLATESRQELRPSGASSL